MNKNFNFKKGGAPIGYKYKDSEGYVIIKVNNTGITKKDWKKEHISILENIIGRKINTKNECVHHINEIKNDNRIENLILQKKGTHSSNHNIGEKNGRAKLKKDDVKNIREKYQNKTAKWISKKYNIAEAYVYSIRYKKTWKNI
jgi:hypothetical protein